MNLEDFYNKFKNKAIIIQAHPHRKKHSKLANLNYLHGIEIRNLNPKHNNNNHLTEKIHHNLPVQSPSYLTQSWTNPELR